MSSVVISGDTSGAITLQAPAVSGNTTLNLPASSGTVLTTTSPKVGNVIQVVSATKTDTQSTSSSTYSDVTNLSVTITPSSASNKILVIASVLVGQTGGNGTAASVNIVRDSTSIISPSSPSSRFPSIFNMESSISSSMQFMLMPASFTILDSPASISALTYKIQFKNVVNGVGVAYINRGGNDGDSAVIPRGVSTITVMEIAG